MVTYARAGAFRFPIGRRPRRIAIQYVGIVAGATASAGFCAATAHAAPAIAGLLGLCIAGLLACMVTSIQVLRGTLPQPVTTQAVIRQPALSAARRSPVRRSIGRRAAAFPAAQLPAGALPAAWRPAAALLPAAHPLAAEYRSAAGQYRLPGPAVRPALPATTARRKPSPRSGRSHRVPSGGAR